MKKLAVLTALIAIAAWPALAVDVSGTSAPSVGFDNYHYRQNINCSDCHSMHASAHDNLNTAFAINTPYGGPYGSAPNSQIINPYWPGGNGRKSLLKTDDVCESCHKDKSFAPSVYGDQFDTSYVRSAGGVREGNVGGGHKIGTTNPPPGYDAVYAKNYFSSGALECVSCHSPHGGVAYRNLGPNGMRSAGLVITRAGDAASVNSVTPTFNKGTVFSAAADVNVKTSGAARNWGVDPLGDYYGRDKVTYARTATGSEYVVGGVKASNRMDLFCAVCHGEFHGGEVTSPVGNGTDFIRHPTSIVLLSGAAHGASRWNSNVSPVGTGLTLKGQKTLGNVKVYTLDGTSDETTSSPGCVSCHKAHGNNNPFGLVYPSRLVADTTEEGGGVYRDLCQSCHPMGGY